MIKATEKTSIDGKIAGMDVTSAVLTSKELGLYQSYNPTGFAPVTAKVHEFDWGTKVQPAINTVVGGALSTVGSAIDSVNWNIVATGVAYGVVIAAASVLAGPLGGASAAAIIIGANAIDTDSVVNRGNKYEA